MPAMSSEGWITLAIILVAALALITERLRPDVTGLMVILALILGGILTPQEAFSGFSQSAVITILAVFVLTSGLEQTGATRWASRQLLRHGGGSERRLMIAIFLTSALLAAFMNNIAAAAVLLPVAMGVARQTRLSPSRLLMGIAFGASLGGTTTLLATANIIVSSTLEQQGFAPFGLFEFTPVGLPIVLAATVVITLLAPKLLPKRDLGGQMARMHRLQDELSQIYHLQEGTFEVEIEPDSSLAGQSLADSGWRRNLGLSVLGISRQGHISLAPDRDTVVESGDRLLIDGQPTPGQLQENGLRLCKRVEIVNGLATEDVPLVEATLSPHSDFEGRTLKELQFRERYGLQAIAIWRSGVVIQHGVADLPLRLGDAILLQGPKEKVQLLRSDRDLLILEEEAEEQPRLCALTATLILAGSLALAATQLLPLPVAMLTGAVLMVLTGCLTMEDAYQSIDWKTIFLVAGMLPLSLALEQSGLAALMAQGINNLAGGATGLGMGAILMLLASTTSLFLGSQAASVIVAPIAIAAGLSLGADPRAMGMATALGCAMAFLTPLAHPVNLLVMGPGGYRFTDYTKLGLPLMVVTFIVGLLGLHWVWGL